jgi:hypothetical protein
MGAYSDKRRSLTAAGSDLARLEEEIDASSRRVPEFVPALGIRLDGQPEARALRGLRPTAALGYCDYGGVLY